MVVALPPDVLRASLVLIIEKLLSIPPEVRGAFRQKLRVILERLTRKFG